MKIRVDMRTMTEKLNATKYLVFKNIIKID